jgi:hypothetical protein
MDHEVQAYRETLYEVNERSHNTIYWGLRLFFSPFHSQREAAFFSAFHSVSMDGCSSPGYAIFDGKIFSLFHSRSTDDPSVSAVMAQFAWEKGLQCQKPRN